MKKTTFSILLMGMGLLGFSQYIPVDIRFYGGSSFEDINCLYPLENGDFIFAGGTRSSDGDLETNNGNEDCWFVHLDSDLDIIKSVSFGESEYESIRDVIALSDTSFLFLISSNSNTGIFSNSNGSTDAWIRTHYYPDWFSPAHLWEAQTQIFLIIFQKKLLVTDILHSEQVIPMMEIYPKTTEIQIFG